MKIKKNRTNYLVPALGTAAVLLILTAGFRVVRTIWTRCCDGYFYPYIKLTSPAVNSAIDRKLLAMDKSTLCAKVTELSERNLQLTLLNADAERLKDENITLRRMLKLSPPAGWRTLTAEILYRDPLRAAESFTIDAGSRRGVVPGAAVTTISTDGRLLLAGVVTEVTARTAKVSTIFNPDVHISARVSGNNAVGFLNTGTAEAQPEQLRFGMLPLRRDYADGAVAATTGFERGIPEGIKIGILRLPEHYGPPVRGGTPDMSLLLVPENNFSILRFTAVFVREE